MRANTYTYTHLRTSTNKCDWDEGEGDVSPMMHVGPRFLNVGDIQVARPENALGRLRIMVSYCIQIQIPTDRMLYCAIRA